MHWTRLALVIVVAAVLQVVINNLLTFAFKPELIIIVMVFLVANTDGLWPVIAAFSCGFAADLTTSMSMGPHMIAYGVVGSGLAFARRSISIDNPVFVAIAVFVVCYMSESLAQILTSLRQQTPSGAYILLIWASLASAVVGPYLCSILAAAGPFLGTRQRMGRRGK
jgi:rod shape-determining protein MreD